MSNRHHRATPGIEVRKGITPLLQEKLIIGLQMQEAIDHLNTALAARKAELILDYTNPAMVQLLISMPGSKPAYWLVANPRNKGKCMGAYPQDPDLAAIAHDIMVRLAKLHAYIAIGVAKNHQTQQSIAKLQVFFHESKRLAITLCETKRGTKKTSTQFELPKGKKE